MAEPLEIRHGLRGKRTRSTQHRSIDLSGRLLAMAPEREQAEPGAAYLRADAQGLGAVRGAVFDGIVCNMALIDIPELAPTVKAVARVLRPARWFVFSILHPCYHTPPSGRSPLPTAAYCAR